MKDEKYTNVEQRILEVLADGERHHNKQLQDCLDDEYGEGKAKTIRVHMAHIRKKLRRKGHDIVCVFYYGKWYYQHIVLLKKDD